LKIFLRQKSFPPSKLKKNLEGKREITLKKTLENVFQNFLCEKRNLRDGKRNHLFLFSFIFWITKGP
jgi:hypothetical protein